MARPALIFRPRGVIALHGGEPAAPPPPPSGANSSLAVARSPEPPPLDLLAGRVLTLRPALFVPPVQRPIPAVVARREEPQPEPGRVLRDRPRPAQDYLPTPPAVIARREEPPPAPGRVIVGPVGFGVPRLPVRPVLIRAEEPPPAAGRVLVGDRPRPLPAAPVVVAPQTPRRVIVARAESPLPELGRVLFGRSPVPPLTPQQATPRPILARVEEPRPFAGLALVGRPLALVPSNRRGPGPVLVRTEPFILPGAVLTSRLRFGPAPPARFAGVLVRAEPPPPFPGRVFVGEPATMALSRQQLPGRPILARTEPPPPFPGAVLILSGVEPAAIPPPIT